METVAARELKANMMKVLKELEIGTLMDITSGGKVIAKIVPPDSIRVNAKNRLKEIGKTAVLHDVISPIDDQWKVI